VVAHQLAEARAALVPGTLAPGDGFAVRAPITGRVLRVMHESEGVVQPGAPLLEVGDLGALQVVVEPLTVDAVRVRPGMTALVDRWGGPSPLAARVRAVEPAGFTKVSALGVEEQRVKVILDLVEPAQARALGDGFRVEVHLVVWESAAALQVPATALFRRTGDWALLVVEAGRLRERRVVVGEQASESAEVRSGLSEGELVVMHPEEALRQGARAEPVLEEP